MTVAPNAGSTVQLGRVAVIPARGGSKRIPNKNIRDLNGRPALEWTILAAQNSNEFERIIVSTDSEDVASCARAAGAEVPFMRPVALSSDEASLRAVMRHAVNEISPTGPNTFAVCCIYATAVLLDPLDLRNSRGEWEANSGYDTCLSVCVYPHPIDRAMSFDGRGAISFLAGNVAGTRTQDLEPRVHDAAQFCWSTASKWCGQTSMLDRAFGYLIPAWRAIDIDNEDDWIMASLLHTALRLRPGASADRS